MNGDKLPKKADRYCDCPNIGKSGRCKHCRSHPKGFIKYYWRRWNRRRINKLANTEI